MKAKTAKALSTLDPAPDGLAAAFTRGMVAAGLLAAVQDRWATGGTPPSNRRVLRLALQGGAALVAGTAAAQALRTRDYAAAAVALAAGAAGVVVAEHLLNTADTPPDEENARG